MKNRNSVFTVVLSLLLIVSLFFSSVHAEEVVMVNNLAEKYDVVQLDENTLALVDEDGNELRYRSDEGQFYYMYEHDEQLIQILDISEDGILYWQIATDQLELSGYVNTSGAPEPQMSVAIGGTSVFIAGALAYVASFAAKVVIAGTTCYVASLAYEAIRKKSNSASYYPAYQAFGTVYVATGIGLSRSSAVKRIAKGKNVWAKSASLAKSACVSASPIGKAEWGQHGKISKGYYPHYHAVKLYKSNGRYEHTGAHCWYYK